MDPTTTTIPQSLSSSSSSSSSSSFINETSSRFAVLGSGASTASPWLQCIISENNCCPVCKEACANPLTNKNVRNNVSGLLSFRVGENITNNNGENITKHVMIDAGKTMRSTVWKCFPALKVSGIDALLLTHAHADAYLGLDDLRDISPKAVLPIYLTQPTYDIIENAFPYLCNKLNRPKPASTSSVPLTTDSEKKAYQREGTIKVVEGNLVGSDDTTNDEENNETCKEGDKDKNTNTTVSGLSTPPKHGHGVHKLRRKPATTFVAQVDFRIITPWVPFVLHEVGDILVTPIPVQHGTKPWDICIAFEFGCRLPLVPTLPVSTNETLKLNDDPTLLPSPTATLNSTLTVSSSSTLSSSSSTNPLTLPPFKGSRILYISDVNAVSDEAHAYFRSRPVDLLIVDCLNYGQYPTHFSMLQAINCSVSYQAKVTRFVGMNHRIDHTLEHEKLQCWGRTYANGENPLDLGLAHDCDPYPVHITHTITPEQLQKEIESVRQYVKEQRHPDYRNEPVMEGYQEPQRDEWKDENSPTVQQILNGWKFF